jgi:hypothetical protein
VGVHSDKPAEFYDLVESLCPASRYLSLIHRGVTRNFWDGYGDEVVATAAWPRRRMLYVSRFVYFTHRECLRFGQTNIYSLKVDMNQQMHSPLVAPTNYKVGKWVSFC